MRRDHFEMVALIPARPEEVYAVLADYRHEHAHIVPSKYLRNLEVEAGGVGAGTVIRYRARAFGIERPSRALISEPEPGRVLVEQETTSTLRTTFTVTPTDDPQQAHIQIATHWIPSRNPFKIAEQVLYPVIMRDMYTRSFQLIAQYVAEKRQKTISSSDSVKYVD
jgi:Polyketide cyclase / dehydrase and lipid transport.